LSHGCLVRKFLYVWKLITHVMEEIRKKLRSSYVAQVIGNSLLPQPPESRDYSVCHHTQLRKHFGQWKYQTSVQQSVPKTMCRGKFSF
jgi:hypothetical protein